MTSTCHHQYRIMNVYCIVTQPSQLQDGNRMAIVDQRYGQRDHQEECAQGYFIWVYLFVLCENALYRLY